jgi:hypothetical protein
MAGTSTTANPSFSTDLRISTTPFVDEKKYPDIYADLQLLHFAVRALQSYVDTLMTPIIVATATESISPGRMVSFVKASDGSIGARNADSTVVAKRCDAFSLGAYGAGSSGKFQTLGINQIISGLTVGTRYYLSTGGGITATSGTQEVGVAISTTTLLFRPK